MTKGRLSAEELGDWGIELQASPGFTDTDCGLIAHGPASGSPRMPFPTVASNETDE